MEVIASTSEEASIDRLNFESPKTASYITSRRSVTLHPQGGSRYHATEGAQIISFLLTGNEWLDCPTLRLMSDLVNNDAEGGENLYILGGCHGFFNRLRLTSGSETIEDITDYARVHEMFHILSASDSRSNDYAEGFCNYWDDKDTKSSQITKQKPLVGIPPTKSMAVALKPLSGLLRQKTLFPSNTFF